MITVLGSTGFIGSNLITELSKQSIPFEAPTRQDNISKRNLGHVIYCIGMTADFRTKPLETVEGHVCKLKFILENCDFESFIYLSSTRLYIKSNSLKTTLGEHEDVVINSGDAFDLFAASKITGELLALHSGRKHVKIVRLSNVFGGDLLSQNFITTIVRDALLHKKVQLLTTPDSSKDYISVNDVSQTLVQFTTLLKSGIYNLAYGANTSNKRITDELRKLTKVEITYSENAQKIIFKEINIAKIQEELGFKPGKNIIESLPDIITAFKI